MLTLERLSLRQGKFELTADFSVETGANAAIIGPSGAGKSTLLSAIAGFLDPVSGRILWQGQDITQTDPGARPLSMIFQDNNLFPHLSAFQNVALGLRPNLRLGPREKNAVSRALAETGLADVEDRKPAALSGGQQSRVALARTLVRARPLILLDEPFAALGPALRQQMLAQVKELAAKTGATVLMVTHNPEDALELGGDTVLVADGIAHAPVPTKPLFDDPPPALRNYLRV